MANYTTKNVRVNSKRDLWLVLMSENKLSKFSFPMIYKPVIHLLECYYRKGLCFSLAVFLSGLLLL